MRCFSYTACLTYDLSLSRKQLLKKRRQRGKRIYKRAGRRHRPTTRTADACKATSTVSKFAAPASLFVYSQLKQHYHDYLHRVMNEFSPHTLNAAITTSDSAYYSLTRCTSLNNDALPGKASADRIPVFKECPQHFLDRLASCTVLAAGRQYHGRCSFISHFRGHSGMRGRALTLLPLAALVMTVYSMSATLSDLVIKNHERKHIVALMDYCFLYNTNRKTDLPRTSDLRTLLSSSQHRV